MKTPVILSLMASMVIVACNQQYTNTGVVREINSTGIFDVSVITLESGQGLLRPVGWIRDLGIGPGDTLTIPELTTCCGEESWPDTLQMNLESYEEVYDIQGDIRYLCTYRPDYKVLRAPIIGSRIVCEARPKLGSPQVFSLRRGPGGFPTGYDLVVKR